MTKRASQAQKGQDLDEEPHWAAQAAHVSLEEARLFVITSWAFVRRPRAFGADWLASAERFQNPAGFFATALALLGIAVKLIHWGAHQSVPDAPPPIELARWARPYLVGILMAVLAHYAMRLFGSRRGLASSIALGMFGTAIAGATEVAATAAVTALHHSERRDLVVVASLAAFLPFALAMAGMHRARTWLAIVIVAVSVLLASRVLSIAYALLGA